MSAPTQTLKAAVRALLPESVYRRYRRWRVASLVSNYQVRQVSHTYAGVALDIEIPDALAEGWYNKDWPAQPEIEMLKRYALAPGSTVFDLGAHHGVVALILADAVGTTGKVIAVEAEPHNARAAERNRVLNAAENITVINAAGAATVGSIRFTAGLNGHVERTARAGTIEIPTVTIDSLAATYGQPDCVFIDVEGFEREVLEGGRAVLSQGGAAFFVEVHVGVGLEGPPQAVAEFFGPQFELQAMSVASNDHRFAPYTADSDVNRAHFFLVALPRAPHL